MKYLSVPDNRLQRHDSNPDPHSSKWKELFWLDESEFDDGTGRPLM